MTKKSSKSEIVVEISKEDQINNAKTALDNAKKVYDEAKSVYQKLVGKKSTEPKSPGVISSIFDLIEKSGKVGVLKTEILASLVTRFPDRTSDGMQKTINVQLPSRMSKEKNVEIIKVEDKFMIK